MRGKILKLYVEVRGFGGRKLNDRDVGAPAKPSTTGALHCKAL